MYGSFINLEKATKHFQLDVQCRVQGKGDLSTALVPKLLR